MCTSWPCPKEQNGESSEMGKVRSLFIKSQTTCMITMVSQLTNYRYANMDFIVFHSLMGSKNKLLLFSYDIACQWSRNLSQHLVQLPNSMQLSDEQLYLLRFAIPKFHISVHGLIANPISHSTTNLTWHIWMAKTRNAGGLTLIL